MSTITIANGTQTHDALMRDALSVRAAAQPMRLRLTARGRRALAILVAMPIIVVGGWLAWSGATATATQTTITAEHSMVTVFPGDTLWSIAEAVAPGADPREVIADITQLNDLAGFIVPGQQLAIPLEYTE